MNKKIEIAEVLKKDGRMVEWAEKVLVVDSTTNINKVVFSEEDKALTSHLDTWARGLGAGTIPRHELATFLSKVVTPEYYNTPTEILNDFLTQSMTVGEFDYLDISVLPKNTLKAIESAKNGNVDKSYIDYDELVPKQFSLQIETEVKWEELRRDGYISIARLIDFAMDEFRNKMFFILMNEIDGVVSGGANEGTGALTTTSMNKMVKYLRGNRESSRERLTALTNSDNAFDISRLADSVAYLSERMKDQLHNDGQLTKYGNVAIKDIESGKTTGNGEALLNPARVYGTAGSIGEYAMRGALRVYEKDDTNAELTELKLTGFSFIMHITKPSKIYKHIIS